MQLFCQFLHICSLCDPYGDYDGQQQNSQDLVTKAKSIVDRGGKTTVALSQSRRNSYSSGLCV
jgi:hypothetical protein